jgi:DNA-directed RNA polymerase specialized sigma24 family protein
LTEEVNSIPSQPSSFIEELMMVQGEVNHPFTDWVAIEQINQAIDQMQEPYGLLLRMVFYDRYSYNQITEMMGYSSKSHTWYHVQKAIRLLKEMLMTHPNIRERYVEG